MVTTLTAPYTPSANNEELVSASKLLTKHEEENNAESIANARS